MKFSLAADCNPKVTAVLSLPGKPGLDLVMGRGLCDTGQVLHFRKNDRIFSEGDKTDLFLKVVSGMVRSYTFLTDGRRQVDAFHIKDDVFGLDCGTEYSLFAEAVCDCTVISYQLPTLEMLARSHERFSDQLLSCMIRNFVRSQEHKRLLAGRTAIAKISAFLLTQAQNSYNGYVVNLLMNQYDLADYLGITVETISRTLATMKHRKIIDFSTSHDIELLCIENLHQLCN